MLEPIQSLINAALHSDVEFCEALAAHARKRVLVVPRGLPRALEIEICEAGIQLQWAANRDQVLSPEPELEVAGTPIDLIAMLLRARAGGVSLGPEVSVRGDAALLQELHRLCANLDIDWESLVARATGDVAAHQLSRFAQAIHAWGEGAARSFGVSAGEWLRYESKLAVSDPELQRYYEGVDDLRDAIDRLDDRMARLSQRASMGDAAGLDTPSGKSV